MKNKNGDKGKNKLPDIFDMKDANSWPKPLVSGKLQLGKPSRAKPIKRGEQSLYDKLGGEWRPKIRINIIKVIGIINQLEKISLRVIESIWREINRNFYSSACVCWVYGDRRKGCFKSGLYILKMDGECCS